MGLDLPDGFDEIGARGIESAVDRFRFVTPGYYLHSTFGGDGFAFTWFGFVSWSFAR